jgi:hypothetical protein
MWFIQFKCDFDTHECNGHIHEREKDTRKCEKTHKSVKTHSRVWNHSHEYGFDTYEGNKDTRECKKDTHACGNLYKKPIHECDFHTHECLFHTHEKHTHECEKDTLECHIPLFFHGMYIFALHPIGHCRLVDRMEVL